MCVCVGGGAQILQCKSDSVLCSEKTADPLSGGGGLKVEKINAEKTIHNLWHKRGWLKLPERRDLHKLFLFFKIDHGMAPLHLSNLLPPIVEIYPPICCKTQ